MSCIEGELLCIGNSDPCSVTSQNMALSAFTCLNDFPHAIMQWNGACTLVHAPFMSHTSQETYATHRWFTIDWCWHHYWSMLIEHCWPINRWPLIDQHGHWLDWVNWVTQWVDSLTNWWGNPLTKRANNRVFPTRL